tara:strand:- start:1579 stop:2223 length:645 start_codon:yes stop_codon:yes gene_type:complete
LIIILIIISVSYIVGSFPTSILISKSYGINILKKGSGNPGMTNVIRSIGIKPGLLVGLIDIFKGWIVTFYSPLLILNNNSEFFISLVQIIAGSSAVIGHTFSIFSKFKGGKGIATLTGLIIAITPFSFISCLLIFFLTLLLSGYVSLSSILASLVFPFSLIFLFLFFNFKINMSIIVFSILIPLFVLITHRENIKRILNGTENKFDKIKLFKKK